MPSVAQCVCVRLSVPPFGEYVVVVVVSLRPHLGLLQLVTSSSERKGNR